MQIGFAKDIEAGMVEEGRIEPGVDGCERMVERRYTCIRDLLY